MSGRLVCACGAVIPTNRAGSERCSAECERREQERVHAEALRQLAEDSSHRLFTESMKVWRERIDIEAAAAALGLNPATITQLSKPDPGLDLQIRVHFVDDTHTDFDVTGEQFRTAVRYTTDAYREWVKRLSAEI